MTRSKSLQQEFGLRQASTRLLNDRWGDLIGPVLSEHEVKELLRLDSDDAVKELTENKELLSISLTQDEIVYPVFQFTETGQVRTPIPAVVQILSEGVETSLTVVSWLRSPKDYLEGETPIDWLEHGGNPETIISGAEQTAARLAS